MDGYGNDMIDECETCYVLSLPFAGIDINWYAFLKFMHFGFFV